METIETSYVGVAFSDHLGYTVKIKLPKHFSRLISPKYKPQFKSRPEVIRDLEFNKRLEEKKESGGISL